MRAHEAVGARDEDGASPICVAELVAELVQSGVGPGGVSHGAYASASVSKRTVSSGLGSLATGAVTAVGLAVQSGGAPIVGVTLACDDWSTAETDGFFASYGVFVV